MGIVPIWGFQLIVAISLAFLFRLNKVLVILAANISIPPMIPLILFASHLTGSIWMGDDAQYLLFSEDITFERVKTSLMQYVLGAITLAVTAGLFFGGVTYAGLKLFGQQKG
jgi:uncharacterized protein (DUF2062 family)